MLFFSINGKMCPMIIIMINTDKIMNKIDNSNKHKK